jgi:hypothetical protein
VSDVTNDDGSRDRGQAAVVFVVVVCVAFVVLAAAASVFGGRVLDRTRAQTAADAVALASVVGGRVSAQRLAEQHGVTILSWHVSDLGDGRVVSVRVRVGDATALAHATDAP